MFRLTLVMVVAVAVVKVVVLVAMTAMMVMKRRWEQAIEKEYLRERRGEVVWVVVVVAAAVSVATVLAGRARREEGWQ